MTAEIAVMNDSDGPLVARAAAYSGRGRKPETEGSNMMGVARYLQARPRQRVTAKQMMADTGISESTAQRNLSRLARERSDVETKPGFDKDGPLPRGVYVYTPGKGPGDLRCQPKPAAPAVPAVPSSPPAPQALEVVGKAGDDRLVVRNADGQCFLLVEIP
jgi:hypothetical protein